MFSTRVHLSPAGLQLLRDLNADRDAAVEVERILDMSDEELLDFVIFERNEDPNKNIKDARLAITEAMASVFWSRPEWPPMMDE